MENTGTFGNSGSDIARLFTPTCDDELKPFVGQTFVSLETAFDFYSRYGYSSGFDVRKGTAKKGKYGQVVFRYFICSREGKKIVASDEPYENSTKTTKKRRRPSTRVYCKARLVLKKVDSVGYVVSGFNEGHSHALVSEDCRHLLKYNRKVDVSHQMILINCVKANIGPMKAFRVFKELVGSYEDVGCTNIDFKNLARDLNAFAEGADAQLILDKFNAERDFGEGFQFDFVLDEEQKLKSLFWADACGIQNYSVFGDAVSFDATYKTNRYNMIFAPFTGKNNHGGCVTFAAGLLTREDVDSYSWLLDKFVQCMGVHPSLIITDQDPALIIAVEKVLPNTRHRYCMWHIMNKVARKLPISLGDNAEFASRLYAIVWSDFDEPDQFEEKWQEVIEEFGLSDHRWFADMYSKRHSWIPAFFRDFKMCGLFKTTSLSESENSFFRRYLNRNANLAVFYMHYGSAIQAQRHAYKQLTMRDETTVPDLKTQLQIERHASVTYTNKVFFDVQIEIHEAVTRCCIKSMETRDGQKMYLIDDRSNGVFHVTHELPEDLIVCSCKQFVKVGLVCRHMFVVMHNIGLECIPKKYIPRRWLRRPFEELDNANNLDSYRKRDIGKKTLYSEAFRCIAIADGDTSLTEVLTNDLRNWADKHTSGDGAVSAVPNKQRMFEMFYGAKIPTTINAHPPDVVHNKGGGKRFKSIFEKESEKAKKPKRRCGKCKRMVRHDSRNCGKFVDPESDED